MIIYVYNGAGTVTESAKNLRDSLSGMLFKFGYDVRFIGSQDVINGALSTEHVKMFVMGGGRFTQVKEALGKKGLANIQNYTHSGGRYLGICMGSYAAFSQIDFRGKNPASGNGLAFVNATGRGSLHSVIQPYDATADSATILELSHLINGERFPALYWGGNGMDEQELIDLGAEPLVKLEVADNEGRLLDKKIMSARVHVGDNGGRAVLCGYHPEGYNRLAIWNWLRLRQPEVQSYLRLEQEILSHPNNAYLMGLACLLDDMELFADYSFVKQVYQIEQGTHKALPKRDIVDAALAAKAFAFRN